MERLIVDSGVLIALERGHTIPPETLPDDADIAIAAITASELLVGVELADDKRRAARKASVDAILATFDVVPFDIEIARFHSTLLAHTRRSGTPRGAHDLQIAATAVARGRVLLTTDERAFAGLPGLQHRIVHRT